MVRNASARRKRRLATAQPAVAIALNDRGSRNSDLPPQSPFTVGNVLFMFSTYGNPDSQTHAGFDA
jgi:hypothetical protein